jgi:hypothetical protein
MWPEDCPLKRDGIGVSDPNTKRLQLLIEAVPRLSRVALLWNPRNAAGTRALGVSMRSLEARSPEELDTVLAAVVEAHPHGLMVTADAMLTLHVRRIRDAARASGLPTMYHLEENAEAGLLRRTTRRVPFQAPASPDEFVGAAP